MFAIYYLVTMLFAQLIRYSKNFTPSLVVLLYLIIQYF